MNCEYILYLVTVIISAVGLKLPPPTSMTRKREVVLTDIGFGIGFSNHRCRMRMDFCVFVCGGGLVDRAKCVRASFRLLRENDVDEKGSVNRGNVT